MLVRKDVRRTATGQVRFDVPKTASSVRVVALPDPRHLPAAMVYLHARVDRGAQLTQALAIAMAESLFATLECELFDQQPGGRFETRREAKLAVFDYLEAFYNPRRRHSALGQISPATFEARHTTKTTAA